MNVFVLGIDHRTAPVELREKFIVAPQRHGEFLELLDGDGLIAEKAVLSTCNRTEIYGVSPHPAEARSRVLEGLSRYSRLEAGQFADRFYFKTQPDSIFHLFSVASGLESMALGETEILGQVKDAYLKAHAARATGPVLNPLFQKSLQVGKKARARTGIGAGKVSVARVAIDLAGKIFEDLGSKNILVVGSGEVARALCEAMTEKGAAHFAVANRHAERAEELVRGFGGRAVPFDTIDEHMARTDILIASAASPKAIILEERVRGWMESKRAHPLFIIDLGVPRNVDERAGRVGGVYLYNIDDLRLISDRNAEIRRKAAESCREIIEAAAAAFLKRFDKARSF